MKYFAIVTVLILILALAGVGYLYMNANIVVEASSLVAVGAADQADLFASLQKQVRLDAVVGTPFSTQQELSGAADYQFFTYTVRLRNNCTVNAEMVELQISPMPGDVLQVGSNAEITLPAGGTADVQCTLLSAANMHGIREVIVTYYIWGVPFSMKTTVN